MSFVQIPLSNTLRMVRTDNRSGLLQNFDNTLLQDEDFVDYNDRVYFQKIYSADDILIQYSTDQTPVTAKIYDLEGTEISDVSGDITLILTSTSFNVYNLSFNIAVEGFYYLKMDFGSGTEVYQSEYFQIDGYETDNIVKIEYNTGENDGIIYDNSETFIIRLEGRLAEYKAGQDKEVYENYNASLVALNSFATRTFVLEYGPLPRYMIEKLNLALTHQVFKVNDVEYQTKEGPDANLLKDSIDITNMYEGKTNLQQVNYEDYTEASDDEPIETYHILIDEFSSKSIMVDGGANYYNRYKD